MCINQREGQTVTEAQGEEVIDLLKEILSELREMKTSFDEFTGYNVNDVGAAVENIGDRITGGNAGVGGATLRDVSDRLGAMEETLGMIEVHTGS
jgi:hypothetical protein